MESREELIRGILSDVEKQDEWDEKKLMSCKEELIQRILSNIEKESEFWDEEELADDNGWYALVENVFKSICGSIYAEMHRKMELPEDILQISLEKAKKYFFCDCILALAKNYNITWLNEELNEEISSKVFYKKFVEFIKDIQNFKIEKNAGDEIIQLKDMVSKDEIKDYLKDKYSLYKQSRRGKEKGVEMNVWKQMERFWEKWIVTADEKNMRKQELIFWLILALIYNFAEDFGSEKVKKAGQCLKYVRDTGSANISAALQWGFKCVCQIIKNDEKSTFIKYFGDSVVSGFISLMDRFNYVQFDVKKRVRGYLEKLFDIPEKHFSSYGVSTMWLEIIRQSIGTSEPLIGKNRSNGKMSTDSRGIVRCMKEIWKDFKKQYILEPDYYRDCYGAQFDENEIGWDEIVRNELDIDVNKFIAGDFLKLNAIAREYGEWNYLFYLEMRLYFDQIFCLVNNGDISGELYEEAVKQLAEKFEEVDRPKKAGRKKQEIDRLEEEESEVQNDDCIKRLLDRRDELLNNFTIAVYFEQMFIDIYWKLIYEIKNIKRVKVHSSLVSRLQKCKEIKESKQINIESDNYISWEEKDENYLILIQNLIICACCMEL